MRYALEFIGNKDFLGEGKNLLEVLCQLRGLGVGRVVTKGEWGRRFPAQPSFVRVAAVEPAMDRWQWHGKVWGDWVFRGRPLGRFLFDKDLDRPDWHLVHRRHEEAFARLAEGARPYEPKALPASVPLPPLLRRLEASRTGHDRPSVPARHVFDPEHQPLAQLLTQAAKEPDQQPKDIYDLDPSVYLDLYGDQLPTLVDKWDH